MVESQSSNSILVQGPLSEIVMTEARRLSPAPDRRTTLPRRGRSTALARFARSSIPHAPHLSRAVRLPRFARARPAPVAPWSAMSSGLDAATRFPSSPLRGSPDPRCRRPPPGYVMPRACPRRLGQPRVTPSPVMRRHVNRSVSTDTAFSVPCASRCYPHS